MRFLADESCGYRIVVALRAAGHDVLAVAETESRTDDEDLLARARSGGRMLLAEDQDFGRLVFLRRQATGGVISIWARLPGSDAIVREVVAAVAAHGERLHGAFVVVQEGKVRIVRRPPP